MTRARAIILLVLAVLAAAFVALRYVNDFSRVKRIAVGDTPLQLGTLNKVVLRNPSSSQVEFRMRCHQKLGDGRPLFSQVVVVPARASVEFDVNPEYAGREPPPMIANKGCEATWRDPFGKERSAWEIRWEYGQRTHKSLSR